MKRRTEHRDERLRGLLRAGDPAADGAEPSPAEVAGWKARMLETAAAPAARPIALAWAIPAAAALLVTGILIGVYARGLHPPPPSRAVAPDTTGAPPALRTIHMSAPGGTRIIWTMNPNLDLGEGRDDRPPQPRRPRQGDQS